MDLDLDLDLGDLNVPKVPSRNSKFAPKTKLKPQPKVPSKSEPVLSNQIEELVFPPPLVDPKPECDKKTEVQEAKGDPMEEEDAGVDKVVRELVSPPPLVDPKAECDTKTEVQEAKDDPMEEEDDGVDKVVREIDVFFTPHIDSNTQLYVLQYPLRPCWRPYDLDERCEEVRVKPMSAEVEVDLTVDVDSQNYDTDANPRVRMAKQTLSSSMKPTRASGYAVGVLIGNKLHINPICAVVQLRTSMEYLRSGSSKKKNSVTSNVEVPIKSEDLIDEKSAGPSNKQNKLPGISNVHNSDIGESWVPLKYHPSESDFSVEYLRKMAVDESSAIQFSMSPYDYISSLCPGVFTDNAKPKGPHKRFLLSLSLEERFRTWLCEGPPANRFDTLKHLAPNDSIEDVLGVLQKLAYLIQGLWVPKTALVFDQSFATESLARDYILVLFHKNPVISYRQVNAVGSDSLVQQMKVVLKNLAIERPSLQDWKFKELPDTAFIKLHPNIVKEQEQVLAKKEKEVNEFISGGGKGQKHSTKLSKTNRPATPQIPSKGVSKPKEAVSKTPMSNETREALPKALQKLFQTHKVCSFQLICQRLREMALSESSRPKGVPREAIAAAIGADAPQAELLEVINQVAINIHGVYVSKSSSDNPQYDAFRRIVIDLLIAEGPKAKLKKAVIVEAAKKQLHKDIPTNEYQRVLSELCVSHGSAWKLKPGDGNPR